MPSRYTLGPVESGSSDDLPGAALAVKDYGEPILFYAEADIDTALDKLNELRQDEAE